MATSKRRSTEKPHPLSHHEPKQARTTSSEQQQQAQTASAPSVSAIATPQSARDTRTRVESGVKIDGRVFPRTTVEVIRPKRRG
jgi:hypothetical protein